MPPDFYHDAQGKATAFWENPTPGYVIDTEGDLRPEVQYVSDGGAPRTFICRDSRLSFQLTSVDTTPGIPDTIHRLDMSFTGELFQAPEAIPFIVREPVRNFYLPHCGANGVTNVHAFERILYPEVYPGIDFWVYGGSSGQKMMIVIRPGANPNNVLLLFEGQSELSLDVFGSLKMLLGNKWIRLPQAVAYQYDQNNVITNVPWTAEYSPNENNGVVGFTFGSYNETKPLVLMIGAPPMGGEPVQSAGLCWSTYLGGNFPDYMVATELDHFENLYVLGGSYSEFFTYGLGTGSNIVPDPHGFYPQVVLNKFSAAHELLWSTYIGGSANTTFPACLSVGRANVGSLDIYIGGFTYTSDFFPMPHGSAYFDPVGDLAQAFLSRFTPSGLLVWSTYFGEGISSVNSMDHDAVGRLVIAGTIQDSDVPAEQLTPPTNAEQYAYSGAGDAFIARLTVNDQLDWSTCYGTPGIENGYNVRCTNTTYVLAGNATTPGLPSALGPNGAYHESWHGGFDVYLAEFNMNGDLIWTTYLGGNADDAIGFRGLDLTASTNHIYLTGTTTSPDLDYVHGSDWYDDTPNGFDSFIAEFDGYDRGLAWLTCVDGGSISSIQTTLTTLRVGDEMGICVAGISVHPGFPYQSYTGVYSSPTIYPNETGTVQDAVYMRFDAMHALLHSTFYGGDGGYNGDHINDLAIKNKHVYLVGTSGKDADISTFFPVYNPGLPAWYRGQCNAAYSDDGFISEFCYDKDLPVGQEEQQALEFQASFGHDGAIQLQGLPPGNQTIDLYSTMGQLVLHAQFRATVAGTQSIPASSLAFGAYMLTVNGTRATLLVKQP